jgi:UDP-glucose 4-epimerase
MTVLVTGGAGLIGATIVRNLLRRGEKVVSLDTTADQRRLAEHRTDARLMIVAGDICDRQNLTSITTKNGVDRIIHMAALLVPTTETDPALGIAVNVAGATNVFEVARRQGAQRVVYPTSMAVYGDQTLYGEDAVVDEDSLRSPYNLYGHAKVMNEEVAKAYTRNFGLSTAGMRIASVFGHGRVTGRSGAISRIISHAAVGEPVESEVAAAQVTPLIYVEDVAESLVRLCFADALERTVYVGGNVAVSVQDVVEIVKRYAPAADIRFAADAQPYSVIRNMDCSRIEQAIDYRLPPLETRIRDHMNLARRERQLPEFE